MVDGLEVCVPLRDDQSEFIDFTGRHENERQPQRHRVADGTWVREFRRGKPSFEGTALIAGTEGFCFGSGSMLGVQPAWSGNTVMAVDRITEDGTAVFAGELLQPGEVVLTTGDTYTTPWIVITACNDGLDGVAHSLHAWERSLPAHPASQPVTLNVWEALYFDQDPDVVLDLVGRAARLGVERFVLDDGWFHARRTDTAGLGDWWVDPSVWPDGLKPLADAIHDHGMQFGLWFEPEMVNPDSDLYREHPDWVLAAPEAVPYREDISYRNQYVLDLANPDAYAHVHGQMAELIGRLGADYIKWDHNREVTEPVHDGRYGLHEQTEACYRLFDQLRAEFPGLEIESCSSGGARTDAGILLHADRIWGSDSNDPRDRVDIQRWTELIVPPEMIGAHVGPSPAHSTGRATDLSYRAAISLEGCSGFEWNILECPDEQVEQLRSFVALYKELRGLLHTGRVMHADMRDPSLRARGVANADRTHAVWVVASVDNLRDALVDRLHVGGLDPERVYRVRQRREIGESKWGWITPQWLTAARGEDGFTVSGRLLEQVGLQLPNLWPMQAIVLEFEAE